MDLRKGREILFQARNELYLHMRFLDLALGSLPVQPGSEAVPAGTDGGILFFRADELLRLYKKRKGFCNAPLSAYAPSLPVRASLSLEETGYRILESGL